MFAVSLGHMVLSSYY